MNEAEECGWDATVWCECAKLNLMHKAQQNAVLKNKRRDNAVRQFYLEQLELC